MAKHPNTSIHSRKRPQQARSEDLVGAILQAAVQVLTTQGAQRFTTARVAEKAGVSVGSLYQYFPNKASILFRLQSDEWRQTNDLLCGILEDERTSPMDRLRRLVHAFVRSECDEAAVRGALDDAAPLYRDAPEARTAKASGKTAIQAFMRKALPDATEQARLLAADLVTTTLTGVGKDFSTRPHALADVDIFADGLADMLCVYLESLRHRTDAQETRSLDGG
jgi:AcrR family transcriptional regulator